MEGEYGAKMLGKLKQMRVLIVGLRGVGIETAKNLILAGPHSVVVVDDELVEASDLLCNFYLHDSDVGRVGRAEAAISKLAELNPNVNVRRESAASLTSSSGGGGEGAVASFIHHFDVMVVCESLRTPLSTVLEWNAHCRSKKGGAGVVAFIFCGISGATGFAFSDFGDEFAVFDEDGTPVRSVIIDHISNATNGVVTIDGDRHLLNDDVVVKFEEVVGLTGAGAGAAGAGAAGAGAAGAGSDDTIQELNAPVTRINGLFRIKSTKNPKRFLIGDTTGLSEYASGGIATQVKQTKVFTFQPLAQQLYAPRFLQSYCDFTKFGRDASLHIARVAVWQFQADHGRAPALHSQRDADAVLAIAQRIAAEHSASLDAAAVDPTIINRVAWYHATELPAMAALFGGIIAQEVTKQTGKYTPLQQWLHFDAFELLDGEDGSSPTAPPVDSDVSEAALAEHGIPARYAHSVALFGAAIQKRVMNSNIFLVGCGALGCEYIKQFALMGLGTGGGGHVHCTDDDRIELSNLSRQFLFRRTHVGQAKSTCCGAAARVMNPHIDGHITCHETRVEPKSEDHFDDPFWEKLDFVVNALDNATARKYTDGKCVIYGKPLFESGTLGTQANSVICLPHLTPSYSEGAVAGEDQGIAKCTLRNFPSEINHCIEWSREKFDDLFVSGPDSVNSLLEDRAAFLHKLKQDPMSEADALRLVNKWLDLSKRPTLPLCVAIIFEQFLANFRNAINDLTHHFPADARVKCNVTGADLGPFWHGHKRFPSSVEFDATNPLHTDYLYHGSCILASVFGITTELSRDSIIAIAKDLASKTPAWQYAGGKVDMSGQAGEEKKSEEAAAAAAPAAAAASSTSSIVNDEDEKLIDQMSRQILSMNLEEFRTLVPAEFEKDVPENHHVDFIAASSNLRAFNYHIKPTTTQQCRMVAGKIIPAIATTTATITGFVGLEIIKYIKRSKLESYRAATINLGTNVFCCENLPDPRKKVTGMDPDTYMQVVAVPEGFTCWDTIVIEDGGRNLTLQQFFDEFSAVHHGCVIDMLAVPNGVPLYNSLDTMNPAKADVLAQRLNTPLLQVYTDMVGPIFPANRTYIILDCTVEDESGNPGFVPKIRYSFKRN